MNRLILVILFCVIYFLAFSTEQNQDNNFLLNKNNAYLFKDIDDWNKFKILTSLEKGILLREKAQHFKKSDSIILSLQSILLSNSELEKTDYNGELGVNYLLIGDLYEHSNLINISEEKYLKALNNFPSTDSLNLVKAYISIARVKAKVNKFNLAEQYIIKAQNLLNIKLHSKEAAKLLNFKAIFYARAKLYNKAINTIDSAILINKTSYDSLALSVNYTTKGKIFFGQKNYQLSYKYFRAGYDLELKYDNSRIPIIKAINLAASLQELGKLHDAEKLYDQILNEKLDYSNSRVMAILYYNLFAFRLDNSTTKDITILADSALLYCKKARKFDIVSSIYQTLSNNFYKNGNIEKLYEYQILSKHYQDSLYINENNRYINNIKVQEILKQLNSSSRNIKSELVSLKRKNRSKLLIIIVLISLLIFITTIYTLRYRDKKRLILLKQQELERYSSKLNLSTEKANVAYCFSEQLQQVFNTLIIKIEQLKSGNSSYINKVKANKIISHSELEEYCTLLDKTFDTILTTQDNFKDNYVEIKARLKLHFPDLTKRETEACFFLKLDYPVKEIALKMNISPRSVEMIKYRLRKKFEFDSMDKFMEYLKSI